MLLISRILVGVLFDEFEVAADDVNRTTGAFVVEMNNRDDSLLLLPPPLELT
jgi:hypothetical protein